jgi:transcriptional regulator with XRE-family HTH domain
LTPRTSLKVAFVVAGVSQRAVSMTTSIPETRLSSIVRGRTEPQPRGRAALSAALGRDERDLFPDEAA